MVAISACQLGEESNFFQRLAKSAHTILIQGPSGSGKTHLARRIHELSPRRLEPLVVVNLATLNENLIESELFGHDKGAFSGATQKRVGRVESAGTGTIFLDEIGELSLSVQTRLLQLLNERVYSPVGSNRLIHAEARFICATNRDLATMVAAGSFRRDLFFRVNSFIIQQPALAGNQQRISQLVEYWRRTKAPDINIHPEVLNVLYDYNWPGNIRELYGVLDYAALISGESELRACHLPPLDTTATLSKITNPEIRFPVLYQSAKAEFERNYLRSVLQKFNGKINLTARETQLSKVTLIDKIKKHGIDVNSIRYSAYATK